MSTYKEGQRVRVVEPGTGGSVRHYGQVETVTRSMFEDRDLYIIRMGGCPGHTTKGVSCL